MFSADATPSIKAMTDHDNHFLMLNSFPPTGHHPALQLKRQPVDTNQADQNAFVLSLHEISN
jgi:hypothetical protein